MRRLKVVYNEDVMRVTPKTKDKCWKWNKNVTELEKTRFRTNTHKENVEKMS